MPTDDGPGDAILGDDPPGVSREEGTPPGEVSLYDGETRAREDLSCPNGCFELEVTAHHEAGGATALIDAAVQDEPGPCPNCGADLQGEADG